MKLTSFTVLNTTDTHLIGEIEYSVFSLFSREKVIKERFLEILKMVLLIIGFI